jgi:hypothetical protein
MLGVALSGTGSTGCPGRTGAYTRGRPKVIYGVSPVCLRRVSGETTVRLPCALRLAPEHSQSKSLPARLGNVSVRLCVGLRVAR